MSAQQAQTKQEFLELQNELAEWDRLSDEALLEFEKGLRVEIQEPD